MLKDPNWIEWSTLATSGPILCMLEGCLVDFLSLGTISRFLDIPRHSVSVHVISRRDADRRATTRSALGNTKSTKRNAKLSQNLQLITSPLVSTSAPCLHNPIAHTHHHHKITLDNVIKKCYCTKMRQKELYQQPSKYMTIRQTSELRAQRLLSLGLINPIV